MWIFFGNEEVCERTDGEGELARDFTHFLTHKSTLISIHWLDTHCGPSTSAMACLVQALAVLALWESPTAPDGSTMCVRKFPPPERPGNVASPWKDPRTMNSWKDPRAMNDPVVHVQCVPKFVTKVKYPFSQLNFNES